MAERKHNFNAGPTALPLSVLKTIESEIVDFQGNGLSLIEMSHRTPEFDEVIVGAKKTLTDLYQIPDTHEVMFLQGGAALQFAMVPLNLGRGGVYINTGTWSTRAVNEANVIGEATELWSGADVGFNHVPTPAEWGPLPSDASYFHYTSNNTIYGTQFHSIPEVSVPLVSDMSSDFISRPLDVSKFDLIYAGAQKNAGPSGVTILIIKKTLIRSFNGEPNTPKILRYVTQAEKDSMYNTPNTFGIWVVKLVAEWVQEHGGLAAMESRNAARAQQLYDVIDAHPMCTGHADSASRSQMNVTFRMENEAQEKAFLAHCAERRIMGVRGHRSVGGLRASIYNAVPTENVDYFCEVLSAYRG